MSGKISTPLAIIVLCFFNGLNADQAEIEQCMKGYWDAFTQGDLEQTCSYIAPSELVESKRQLLPVFLQVQKHPEPHIQELVSLFFEGQSEATRNSMSASQVYQGLGRIINSSLGQTLAILKNCDMKISEVNYLADKTAMVHYQLWYESELVAEDSETFLKENDRWYLKLKEAPVDTAKKFRVLFQNE